MWRAISYGNKATRWFVYAASAQREGNRVFGRGMWTLEFRDR